MGHQWDEQVQSSTCQEDDVEDDEDDEDLVRHVCRDRVAVTSCKIVIYAKGTEEMVTKGGLLTR
jgi:hypothetical protein